MTKLIVDGVEVDVPAEYTLLQACEEAGAEIPRFCFHERLSIAGNCRMCLVELKGAPKPVASCAWAVRDCRPGPNGELPTVVTKSPMVKKARNGVMEFLLINHPLDCPICDQGGECDLQDQAMAFGVDSSRYQENKRAVEDKYIGPLVRTSMNRCIHCTRCVRFTAEVAGTADMGAIGRGEDMEITTYLETAMGSELQGNVADLCPVGALLPKPYSFKARPWELGKTQSIDVMDALGRASYIFNPTVAGIEEADGILIIGSNPRKESPVFNARIRKRWRQGNFKVGVIGEQADLTYDTNYLGAGVETLARFVENPTLQLEKPIILVGQGALAREDGAAILALAAQLATKMGAVKDGWNGFGVLHTAAARVGGLDLGFVPGQGGLDAAAMAAGGVDVLFNLGADELDVAAGPFVVYIGTHGDRGAHRADVILPSATYTEKSGTYVNTEGRPQRADRANFPPGDAREDWAILRALSDVLGHRLPFDSLVALRRAMNAAHPHLAALDEVAVADAGGIAQLAGLSLPAPSKAPFVNAVADFYLTNPIARASAVMAECSALAASRVAQAAE